MKLRDFFNPKHADTMIRLREAADILNYSEGRFRLAVRTHGVPVVRERGTLFARIGDIADFLDRRGIGHGPRDVVCPQRAA